LDLKLLDRTTRFVKLTSVGEDFLPQARSIVHDMSAAVTRLKDKSKHSTGNFTLSCVPTMAAYILPNLIRLYAEKFPNNRIRLVDATSYQVREAVLSNQAEVGISIHGEKHPNLVETQLFEDPLMFFCRENHPLSKKKSVRWSDMSDANLIVVSNFVATRVFMDYQLAKRGISLTGAYEVQHHATAINLVAAGVGCSILPSSSCGENDRPGVIRIPLIDPIVKRKVVLIQRKGATLSPAAAAFCDVLKKVPVESLSKKKRLII
jgi:DNA-binding transcriptional LysR family regulator